VLATARKDFDASTFDSGADLLPLVSEGLELMALVGIVDPPRPTAKASIASARGAGIRVRMITGDHAVTAGAIARQLGIEGGVMTGAEFAGLDDDQVLGRIDEVGVIARVTPEDKVRLVDLLKRQGHIVAMTGDGVNDAPALKKADIGIAMGITGTEVAKDAAVMVLTDDNFSSIVKAVELGRGLYDNLVKYIRFQMGCLFGFIVSFLGAAILNIGGGVPFLPLQTLWINFTTMLFQAVGLGYGEPGAGLMERPPRDPEEPILSRPTMLWLVTIGLVMGAATLGTIAGAESAFGRPVALTMGVVSFSLACLVFSLATRDEARTVFSLDTLADKTLVRCTAATLVTLLLTTVFGPLQTFLGTVALSTTQWLICAGAPLLVLLASELRVLVRRRRAGVSSA
jgi:Ca2+-transporting ATPase